MVTNFKIETVEERLVVYRWLVQRYIARNKTGMRIYKIRCIDPFSLGICFYLKRTTNIKFEDLPEMYNHYHSKVNNEELLFPKGDLPNRIVFLKEVVLITKNKCKQIKN